MLLFRDKLNYRKGTFDIKKKSLNISVSNKCYSLNFIFTKES